MIGLGSRIRYGGRDGMVVAKTLGAEPLYDLRFSDGSVTTYVTGSEVEVVAPPEKVAAAVTRGTA